MAGWLGGGQLEELKIRQTQPSVAGTGAELGKKQSEAKMISVNRSGRLEAIR